MIPIFLIGSIVAILGYAISHKSEASHTGTPHTLDLTSGELGKSAPHIAALLKIIGKGKEPPEWLINEAMCEAYDRGNYKLIQAIHKRYGETDLDTPIPTPSEDDDGNDPTPGAITVSGKSSPIDGVSNGEWEDFVSRLETDAPEFSTDRHVGKYHLSRERLKQLGIEEVGTGDQQYDALLKILEDSRSQCANLISENLANVVTIDGKEYPVTLSGILGVLKAAGVKHARSWLESPDDRGKYPQTTKIFLATNGVF